jgi:hypothetical protein
MIATSALKQKNLSISAEVYKYEPGDVLLSHGETPHYHRRYCVSLLSSEWNQVGPQRYGRQVNSLTRY